MNLSQSTNDVYPTAVKLALHHAIEELREAMREARRRVSRQGKRVLVVREDGAHAVAGCGPDDARPGVRRVRAHDAGRRRPLGRGAGVDPRDQHGRDRDRHRHHDAAGLRRNDPPRAVADHRSLADHGAGSGGGDVRHGRVRADVGRAQALRGEAVEDLQRSPPLELRPARRVSARSTCRRCSRDRRSCRAR